MPKGVGLFTAFNARWRGLRYSERTLEGCQGQGGKECVSVVRRRLQGTCWKGGTAYRHGSTAPAACVSIAPAYQVPSHVEAPHKEDCASVVKQLCAKAVLCVTINTAHYQPAAKKKSTHNMKQASHVMLQAI